MENQHLPLVLADWDAPDSIVAFTTTTAGGVSIGDCTSLNLGTHVSDNQQHVSENRCRLQSVVGSDVTLSWLNQTHSDIIIDADNYSGVVEADASVANLARQACVVMTADCLPVLLCNQMGTRVAALHCGWRGLYSHVIQKTINQYFRDDSVIAWLGPAIGPHSYEVDSALYQRFTTLSNEYDRAFSDNRPGHYLMNLYEIARQQLTSMGVDKHSICGGNFDTFTDKRFFSHRRSSRSGRIASVIYVK